MEKCFRLSEKHESNTPHTKDVEKNWKNKKKEIYGGTYEGFLQVEPYSHTRKKKFFCTVLTVPTFLDILS